jgi:hypothetical protein
MKKGFQFRKKGRHKTSIDADNILERLKIASQVFMPSSCITNQEQADTKTVEYQGALKILFTSTQKASGVNF